MIFLLQIINEDIRIIFPSYYSSNLDKFMNTNMIY